MKEFVEYILKTLVNHPGKILISEVCGKQSSILEVRCHPEDMGRVIGKNGKTIGAVRMLLSGFAAKQKRKAVLEVVE